MVFRIFANYWAASSRIDLAQSELRSEGIFHYPRSYSRLKLQQNPYSDCLHSFVVSKVPAALTHHAATQCVSAALHNAQADRMLFNATYLEKAGATW